MPGRFDPCTKMIVVSLFVANRFFSQNYQEAVCLVPSRKMGAVSCIKGANNMPTQDFFPFMHLRATVFTIATFAALAHALVLPEFLFDYANDDAQIELIDSELLDCGTTDPHPYHVAESGEFASSQLDFDDNDNDDFELLDFVGSEDYDSSEVFDDSEDDAELLGIANSEDCESSEVFDHSDDDSELLDVEDFGFFDAPFLPESGQIVSTPLSFEDDSDMLDFEDLEDAMTFEDWKTTVVDEHNWYRAHYGAGPVTWSDELYAGTDVWANCMSQYSSVGDGYGENWAAGTGASYGFLQAMTSWMDEADDYDYNNPGFSRSTGHFTQIVWKGTRHVACAIADCEPGTIFGQASKMVVCRYDAPGNVIGRFPENVGIPH